MRRKPILLVPVFFYVFLLSSTFISCRSLRHIGYENGHQYVDLGLSVNWATMNVGALAPQDSGAYYAWGELEPKDFYSWWNYRYYIDGDTGDDVRLSKYVLDSDHGIPDNRYTLEQEDDVAFNQWGGRWRLPTEDEFYELMNRDNCTWTWTTLDGVNGYKVQSNKKGYRRRYIFLPAGHARLFDHMYEEGQDANYWSGTPFAYTYASIMWFNSTNYDWAAAERLLGLNVRPVYSKNGTGNSTFKGDFIYPNRGYKGSLSGVRRFDKDFEFYIQDKDPMERVTLKLGLGPDEDSAIRVLQGLIDSWHVGDTVRIQGYTFEAVKGKAYHAVLTGPLSQASADSRYWVSLKNLKDGIKALRKCKDGTLFRKKLIEKSERTEEFMAEWEKRKNNQ